MEQSLSQQDDPHSHPHSHPQQDINKDNSDDRQDKDEFQCCKQDHDVYHNHHKCSSNNHENENDAAARQKKENDDDDDEKDNQRRNSSLSVMVMTHGLQQQPQQPQQQQLQGQHDDDDDKNKKDEKTNTAAAAETAASTTSSSQVLDGEKDDQDAPMQRIDSPHHDMSTSSNIVSTDNSGGNSNSSCNNNNPLAVQTNTQDPQESDQILAAVLDELEMERARRIQAEWNLSEQLKLQSHLQSQVQVQVQVQVQQQNVQSGVSSSQTPIMSPTQSKSTSTAMSSFVSTPPSCDQVKDKVHQVSSEEKNDDASIVAREIHGMFQGCGTSSIPKRILSIKLSQFFHKICHGLTDNPSYSSDEMNKILEPLLPNAMNKVYSACRHDDSTASTCTFTSNTIASRLRMRRVMVDYNEETLRPVLQRVAVELLQEFRKCYFVDRLMYGRSQGLDQGLDQGQCQDDLDLRHGCDEEKDGKINNTISRQHGQEYDIQKLKTERDAYRSIVNVLTCDHDAVMLAARSNDDDVGGCLPLHQVMCLEYMPWEDRVRDYILMEDEVYQWQVWDDWGHRWSDKKVKTVPFFQRLPIDKMQKYDGSIGVSSSGGGGSNGFFNKERDCGMDSENRQSSPVRKIQHAFESLGLKGRFLTDSNCERVLDLSDGYPLPTQGTWEWVNNWSLSEEEGLMTTSTFHHHHQQQQQRGKKNGGDQHDNGDHDHDENKDDNRGWVYADNLDALLIAQGHRDGKVQYSCQSTSKFRKRTWTRKRVLVSYPGISLATKQMLEMNAHNTRLTIALSKLHGQVHDLQNKLFQKEEELEMMQEYASGKKTSAALSSLEQSTMPTIESREDRHPIEATATYLRNMSVKDDDDNYKDNSHAPRITVEDMTGNESDSSNKDVNVTATHDIIAPTGSDHVCKEEEEPIIHVKSQPSVSLESRSKTELSKRIDSYNWMINSDLFLESMKHNVQSAKQSVQTISKKAQHIIVNSKVAR